jgi:hypothetical protein
MNPETQSRTATAAFHPPAAVDRVQRLGLIVGGVAALASLLGLFFSPSSFFRAYLVGWVYWVSIALGCLAVLLLNHLTRGAWGLVIRRVMEAASRTLPLMLLLFLPILFGMDELYLWASPEGQGDPLIQAKEPYLNVPFFVVRLVLYFVIWSGLAFWMSRLSWRQDETADPHLTRRMQLIAAPGLAAWALAVTFAAVDWLMSLEPHWFSTIYGVYLMGGCALAALGFLIAFAAFLSRREPMDAILQPRHFHDLGKLLLAFVMLWAYFSFSQFLIIWSGNLPEETHWFDHRTHGGWGFVALLLVVFHFALPFVLLLSRDLKRKASVLGGVALLMLGMRWVDLLWQVEPAFEHGSAAFFWLYLTVPAAIGGLWLFAFVRELKKRPLLPVNDPYFPEAIAHE